MNYTQAANTIRGALRLKEMIEQVADKMGCVLIEFNREPVRVLLNLRFSNDNPSKITGSGSATMLISE